MWFPGDPMPDWLPDWLRIDGHYAVVPLSDDGDGRNRYLIASDDGYLWAIHQRGDDYEGATILLVRPSGDDGARGDATHLMTAIKYAMRRDLA